MSEEKKSLDNSELSQVRRSYGWTLKRCSEEWKISPQHLSSVERGARGLTEEIRELYVTLLDAPDGAGLKDRIVWTDDEIRKRIREVSCLVGGRMPTVAEMRRFAPSWGNALACRLSKSGGVAAWARSLDLDVKEHCSGKGWMWEEWVAAEVRHQGYEVERRMDVKAPFDLMVGEGCRVDVKVSEHGRYGPCHGWFFAIRHKLGACDFYVFVCLEDGAPRRVYVMPDGVAPVTTLTITRAGKYEKYRNAWGLMDPQGDST